MEHHSRSIGYGGNSSLNKQKPVATKNSTMMMSPRNNTISIKRSIYHDKGTDSQTDQIDWIVDTIAYLI